MKTFDIDDHMSIRPPQVCLYDVHWACANNWIWKVGCVLEVEEIGGSSAISIKHDSIFNPCGYRFFPELRPQIRVCFNEG